MDPSAAEQLALFAANKPCPEVTSGLAIGAVLGILIGGYAGDRLLRRGVINGRIIISVWSQVIAAAALFPAFGMHSLAPAIPLYIIGGARPSHQAACATVGITRRSA